MTCPKCKKESRNTAKFCGYCGNKFNTVASSSVSAPKIQPVQTQKVNQVSVQQPVSTDSSAAKCRKCGSTSLQARKKGINAGNAVMGALIAGPLGLAVGAVGKDDVEIVCLNCGFVFKP